MAAASPASAAVQLDRLPACDTNVAHTEDRVQNCISAHIAASLKASQLIRLHPHAESSAPATEATPLHCLPLQATSTQIIREVPLYHPATLNAAVIMSGAAAVAHMAASKGASQPPLQHQHPEQQATHDSTGGICEEDDLNEDKSGTMTAPLAQQMQFMSRSGIQIRRIDNPTSRQVTFSKRRNGVLKKAYELSVLCDAEVGVIIFSGTGRLYEFASTSMPEVLERYQEHANGLLSRTSLLRDIEYWRREVLLLRDQIYQLRNMESYLLGENLLRLDLSELQNVEQRLEIALNKIRIQKVHLLQAEAEERYRHELRLSEENDLLRSKLHVLREQMKKETKNLPPQGGDWTMPSMGRIITMMPQQEFPSSHPTLKACGIYKPPRLQLGLKVFPGEPSE